jgi:glycosyltransferase involved in cell wall biosynthesis
LPRRTRWTRITAKEIIVVNDGSNDGTLAILQGFGDAIRLIDQNGGPPLARNVGLRAARGNTLHSWMPTTYG